MQDRFFEPSRSDCSSTNSSLASTATVLGDQRRISAQRHFGGPHSTVSCRTPSGLIQGQDDLLRRVLGVGKTAGIGRFGKERRAMWLSTRSGEWDVVGVTDSST